MQSSCEVAIIGGGVIGLACAWRLAQSGARVQLFERGEIGREASHAAAGMLAAQCEAAVHPPTSLPEYSDEPSAFLKLCLQSRDLYPAFAEELLEFTGIDVELSLRQYSRCYSQTTPGILYMASKKDDPAIERFEWQALQKYGVEKVSPELANFPFAKGSEKAEQSTYFWLPNEGRVENRNLVKALEVAALKSGVQIFANEEVRNLQMEDKNYKVTTQLHETICGKVLLCAGAWSTRFPFLPKEIFPIVRPVGGQMLEVRKQLSYIIYSSDVYFVPRGSDRLLVGATIEETGFRRGYRKNTTVAGMMDLMQRACAVFPDIESCPILDQWAGLRPATADGLPVLGRTSMENIFIATGHFRNGILLTPITAKLMTDCILHETNPLEEFSISRFDSQNCGQGKLTSCA